MKKIPVSIVSALLVLFFAVAGLNGCSDAAYVDPVSVRVSVLSGTTGFGMAPLMQKSRADGADLPYTFSVETDASVISSALVNGSVDIAALPTNAASVLYNKTKGGVRVIALNTAGVLYLLDNGNGISSVGDLKGKTVAVPTQNPTYIFTYICQANGLRVATVQSGESADVLIDNAYASPAELQSNVAAGKVTLAVLPEPLVTVVTNANESVSVALDLTAEWDKIAPAGSLVQGCVVVRSAFADEHPDAVDAFLRDYGESLLSLTADPDAGAKAIVAGELFAREDLAKETIPRCNLCFITGQEMKTALSVFLSAMYDLQPASVGGALPDDGFYYIGK